VEGTLPIKSASCLLSRLSHTALLLKPLDVGLPRSSGPVSVLVGSVAQTL
jgi:hypothetical protein